MTLKTMANAFAAGVLTWTVLAVQSSAAETVRGPKVHSEASASSNTQALHRSPNLRVQAGSALQVRLNRSLSTAQNRPGDRFTATLAEPVMVNGKTAFPKGAQVTGVVEESAASGRFKGRAHMTLALKSIEVNGRAVALSTSPRTHGGEGHGKHNAAWIGGGSGTGALIGGLAGGPVGLAIGAGSGAAAGLAGSLVTGRKQDTIPAETLVTFRLRTSVTVPAQAERLARQRN